jgi:hypothetical protein
MRIQIQSSAPIRIFRFLIPDLFYLYREIKVLKRFLHIPKVGKNIPDRDRGFQNSQINPNPTQPESKSTRIQNQSEFTSIRIQMNPNPNQYESKSIRIQINPNPNQSESESIWIQINPNFNQVESKSIRIRINPKPNQSESNPIRIQVNPNPNQSESKSIRV